MTVKTLRILIAVVLLVLAGRTYNANAQTERILYSFGTFFLDGARPIGALIQGSDGNFYGATEDGGTDNEEGGLGTLFRISPGGSYTNFYSFKGQPDGRTPKAGLVQASDGNFYGTTSFGGTNNTGSVFRISPGGTYTSLYSFVGYPSDGESPEAGLVQGSDGSFYGTTFQGGPSTNCPNPNGAGCGTVFRISPSGNYTSLYSFGSSPGDGEQPMAGLVQGSDGNFYGTTQEGGASGQGTVFRISPSGNCAILYSFGSFPHDGANPQAGLVPGSDGDFYGTTFRGGTTDFGTVFRVSPNGSYTNLYSFVGSPNDGQYPNSGLVLGSDGNFYGTTVNGGTRGSGIIFRFGLTGSYSELHSFSGLYHDGENPVGLVQGSDGNFYGTTAWGGTNGVRGINVGTVFELSVPLNPPANQISGIQLFSVFDTMNAAVQIPSVAGETYQLQYSDSLSPVNWLNTGGTITSIGGPLILIDIADPLPPQRFYRAVITP